MCVDCRCVQVQPSTLFFFFSSGIANKLSQLSKLQTKQQLLHSFTNCTILAMYRHKSGALKRKERAEKESKTLAQQRSLLSFGFTSKPPNGRSCTADQKPTEDQNCVQNTSDCDSSSIDESTFTTPTEYDTGARAVLDLPLAVDIIQESPTITDSIAVKDNDIGHLFV